MPRNLGEPRPLSLQLGIRGADRVDVAEELLATLADPVGGSRLVVQHDQLAERPVAPAQFLSEPVDVRGDGWRPGDHLEHQQLAPLDPLRDRHLALAGEERNGSHLPQVHPDRIACLLHHAGRQVERTVGPAVGRAVRLGPLRLYILLLGLDYVDSGRVEGGEQLVQIVGRNFGGKQLVDLLEEQETAFLSDDDQLLDLVVLLFDRQRLVRHTVTSRDPRGRRAPVRFAGANCSESGASSSPVPQPYVAPGVPVT